MTEPPLFSREQRSPFGSVLAVKGTLRRFAPWTAPGRSDTMKREGKGGRL